MPTSGLEQQLRPAATSTLTGQKAHLSKAKVRGIRIDVEAAAERGRIMEELYTGTQWRGPGSMEDSPRESAPMMIMMNAVELDSQPKELCPWFLDGWN